MFPLRLQRVLTSVAQSLAVSWMRGTKCVTALISGQARHDKRKLVDHLVPRPGHRRGFSNVEAQHSPPLMVQDDKHIQNAKRNRGDSKEVKPQRRTSYDCVGRSSLFAHPAFCSAACTSGSSRVIPEFLGSKCWSFCRRHDLLNSITLWYCSINWLKARTLGTSWLKSLSNCPIT